MQKRHNGHTNSKDYDQIVNLHYWTNDKADSPVLDYIIKFTFFWSFVIIETIPDCFDFFFFSFFEFFA